MTCYSNSCQSGQPCTPSFPIYENRLPPSFLQVDHSGTSRGTALPTLNVTDTHCKLLLLLGCMYPTPTYPSSLPSGMDPARCGWHPNPHQPYV